MTDQKNVVGLKKQRKPNECCVSLLESVLEAAKRGEIIGVALISIEADNTYGCAASEVITMRPLESLGMVEVLRARILGEVELP
jgi:hypothetical protein